MTFITIPKLNAILRALKIECHYLARKRRKCAHLVCKVQRQLTFSSLEEIILTQQNEVF